jgi:hypothetical protein
MSTSLVLVRTREPVDKPKATGNHLIYSYFVESTGIYSVFSKLLSSFYIDEKYLKLNKDGDDDLIELLKETANEVFPKPASSITPPLPELRYNAYFRLFGYTIKGNETFPRPENYNSEFNKTLNEFGTALFTLILDKGITSERLGSPHTVAELANAIRKQMEVRTYNTIRHIADDSAIKSYRLIELLQNEKLMVERLGIRSETLARTLIELGEKVKAPVAKESSDLFLLAGLTNTLLLQLQSRDWTSNLVENLVNDENTLFFKALESSWSHVTGVSWMAQAMKSRRKL